ncbi:MAG TPA: hypothetical protein PK055_10850 [Gammaproteobacteria bacterium]|nr:hypothetical protein [Xanthomonadales bacterium]MCB1593851.1 hypothetical protein [Xanthomonadales bacterium]HPI96639.1 hypothetical protein [Gammaproteobacteria bacterium]HPQ88147.1 hypothetical protein [Gammaproteobacteria bacterium]
MTERTPTWHKEAKQKEISFIVLVYGKAEGFVFCPDNLEKPFRVGGDYDGNWPVTAQGALRHIDGYFNNAFRDKIEWFIPFVRKVINNQDFSIRDLKLDKKGLKVIKGKWPW